MLVAQKLTGIVVDDDNDIVELFSEFFEMKGISVVGHAYNGCEAVEIYKKTLPDFIVLDMKMPVCDGDYAIREIRKINPDAKIFVVRGYSEFDNLELDATAVFTKPCNLSKLYEYIKKFAPEQVV